MKATRKLNRRSFLGRVAGGATAVGAMGLIASDASAFALDQGCSDSDSGPNSDPGGSGRSCRSSCSDSDSGPNSDPGGRGRSCGQRAACTDSDRGPNADPGGRGRSCGRTNVTDYDRGPNADPPGYGRGARRCSDSDSGPNADPGGRGRSCTGRRRTGVTDSDSGGYADAAGLWPRQPALHRFRHRHLSRSGRPRAALPLSASSRA